MGTGGGSGSDFGPAHNLSLKPGETIKVALPTKVYAISGSATKGVSSQQHQHEALDALLTGVI